MKLQRFKIGTRLGAAFALVLCITALVAGLAITRLQTLAEFLSHEASVLKQRELAALRWSGEVRLNLNRGRSLLYASDADYVRTLRAEMETTSSGITESIRRLNELGSDPRQQQAMEQVGGVRADYMRQREVLFKAKVEGVAPAPDTVAKLGALGDSYLRSLESAMNVIEGLNREESDRSLAYVRNSQWVIGGAALAALLAGLCAAVMVTLSIIRPLAGAIGVAETVADGDLSRRVEVTGQDETASLLSSLMVMREKLSAIVFEVRANSEGVASTSKEIAAGNNDLSARTEQQASSLEQTAASMEQLNATVKQNAEHAQQASELASQASDVAVQGGAVVNQVVETMKGINDSARRIADIIGVIDGIAFQTNILALNAAVEAARAGEQGRGFAVVASEVRSLAQRSADAAKEIKALISASVQRVGEGTEQVDQAGRTMEQVVSSIRRVAEIVGEISAASHEQSLGVAQVGEAVAQMDQATQQNAALVEQSSAAAAVLKDQADQLVRCVSVFRVTQRAGDDEVTDLASRPVPLSHPARSAKTRPAVTRKPAAARVVPAVAMAGEAQGGRAQNDSQPPWPPS